MRIGLVIFLFGAIVAAADSDDLQISQNEIVEQASSRAECSTGKACNRRNGTCVSTVETCKGRVIDKGCGENCICCITEADICEWKQSCKEANGFCVKDSNSCTGSILDGGCKGGDCVCCVNDNKCPNGFYRVGTECFKVYEQFAGWDEARHICRSNGWELAEPEDLPALAEFIYYKISHYYFWIGGRGIGDSFKYISGQSLQNDAPWGLGYPGDVTSVGDCLILRSTNTSYMTSLASTYCYSKYYFVCEPSCPKGFIRSGSGCFKAVPIAQSWENSEKDCYADGLQIAEPENPKSLAKLLYDGIGGIRYTSNTFWIGARGGRVSGSLFAWNSGDEVPIHYPNNNTWSPSSPRYTTSAYCLRLYTRSHITGPLAEAGCTAGLYSICELICPSGFFHIGNKCSKAYSSSASSWAEAREICTRAHLTLAEPQDPTAVAHYLNTRTGHHNYWLGGRGDGNRFRWTSGEAIPNSWAPWWPGNPGNKVGTDYCIRLSPEHRITPLTSTTCSTKLYPLCQ